MKIVEYTSILKNNKIQDLAIAVGQTRSGFILWGPRLGEGVCWQCFSKRINSSSYFSYKNYIKIKDFSKVKKMDQYPLNKNEVLEFKQEVSGIYVLIKKHFVAPVPGCKVCFCEK